MDDAAELDFRRGFCPRFQYAVELLGSRWTGAILFAMLGGAERYSEIRDAVPDLSDRLLSKRLTELEDEGVLVREVTSTRPPQVNYLLTEKGSELLPAVRALLEWSHDWVGETEQSAPHG